MSSVTSLLAAATGTIVGVPAAMWARRIVVPDGRWPAGQAFVLTAAVTSTAAAWIMGAVTPLSVAAPAFWIFAAVGAVLGWTDAFTRRLPHQMTIGLILSCGTLLLTQSLLDHDLRRAVTAVLTMVGVAILLLTIALLRPGELGLGDVVYASAVALMLAWFGWTSAVMGIGVALAGHAILAAGLTTLCSEEIGPTTSPLGPALTAGWIATVMVQS